MQVCLGKHACKSMLHAQDFVLGRNCASLDKSELEEVTLHILHVLVY